MRPRGIERLIRRWAGRDAFWAGLLLGTLFVLSYPFLPLWFMHDDASSLYGATRGVLELLFDRDVYRSFNKMFYTPLLAIALKPDLHLFGLRPLGCHAVGLLAVFIAGLAGYAVARRCLPRAESWMAAFLFLLSYPAVTCVGYLTLRHYVWGTTLTLAAFLLFKKGEEDRWWGPWWASYGAYLGALLCKESFAAFPGVVLLVSRGGLRERAMKTVPYVAVFAAYFGLRSYMLGGMGGYLGPYVAGSVGGFVEHWAAQMDLLCRATWGVGAGYALPLLLAVLAWHGRRGAWFAGVFLFLTAPFWLLRMPAEEESFRLFYLPPRFLLPFFLLSTLPGLTAAKVRGRAAGVGVWTAAAVLLLLQLSHARNAYVYMKAASEHTRDLCLEALRRNERGHDILVASRDALFYGYFYACRARLLGGEGMGKAISLSPAAEFLPLVSDLNPEDLDDLYLDGKWCGGVVRETLPGDGLRVDPALRAAGPRFSLHDGTVRLEVPAGQRVTYYAVLRTALLPEDILYQVLPLPGGMRLEVGISRGTDTVSVYACEGRRCGRAIRPGEE